MSMVDFHIQVALSGVQPSPSRGGGTSATQEPEPTEEHTPVAEDELASLEPFSFSSDLVVAQEEVPSLVPIPEPTPAPISEDTLLLAILYD